jgi:hypothetical protein
MLKAEALAGVSQALVQAGEVGKAKEVVGRALAAAQTIQYESNKASALTRVSQALANTGDREGLGRALLVAEAIQEERYKAKALSGVTQAFIISGQNEMALRALFLSIDAARRAYRENVFDVVKQVAPWLARRDRGATLWKIYQSIEEVDSWWRPSRGGPGEQESFHKVGSGIEVT